MAFEYLGGSTDLSNLIFNEILKISPILMSKYYTLQDQVLYLILIPSVIILLFVWTFGYWFMGGGHRGLRLLISAIAYIYIVYAGWYGTFVIPLILAWFPIVLIAAFAFFLMTKIFHPMNIAGASKVMKSTFQKATAKSKKIDKLERQHDVVTRKIRQLENRLRNTNNDRAKAELIARISDLNSKKVEIEDKLDQLG